MPDIIITPSTGKLEFIDNSAQNIRKHAFSMDEDGLSIDAPLAATSIKAPLNIINVNVDNSNTNYPFVLASGSAVTGIKTLMMDGAGGTYNPFTNIATIDISGNSATTTLASNSTQLGGVAAASYVTLTGTQTLTNKTITGTFTGNLTGTGSWATNAVSAVSATNSTQLNGQAASYYTDIVSRLGYTPVNQAGGTVTGNLTVNGNFSVNGSFTAFSASNVYISSSQLYIEDNILTLNAFSPYLRYAGVEMYDSGSGTLSSLLWDGEADYFFLTGSSVNGKIITGPDGQTNLTANYIPKATAGYKLGNSLIYDNGTNVGIGTTSPLQKLHVVGNISTIAQASSGAEASRLQFYNIGADTYDIASIRAFVGAGQTNRGELGFYVNNGATQQLAMYIDRSQNVGIGTSIPTQILDVRGNIKLGADSAGNYIYYVKDNEGTIIRTTRSDVTQEGLFRSDGWGNFTVNKSIGIGYSLGSGFDSNAIGNGNLYVAGKVGIGTTSPVTKLEVYRLESTNRTTTTDILTINADANNFPYSGHGGTILFRGCTYSGTSNNAQGNRKWGQIGMYLTDAYNQFSGENMFFAVASDDRSDTLTTSMTIQYNGNIGIGVTTPTQKLEVAGYVMAGESSYRTSIYGNSGGAWIGFGDTSNTVSLGRIGAYGSLFNINSINGDTSFQYNGSEKMRITTGGNVGIGTTNPVSKLEVSGSVTATSFTGSLSGSITSALTASYLTPANSYTVTNLNASATGSFGIVGIGTTSPGAKLEINTPTSVYTGFTGGSNVARFNALAGTGAATALLLTNYVGDLNTDTTVDLDFAAVDSNSVLGAVPHARIGYTGFYNAGINVVNEQEARGYFRIATRGEGSAGVLTDKLVIDYLGNSLFLSGSVGIGTTSPGTLLNIHGANPFVRINNTTTADHGIKISYNNSDTHGLHLLYNANSALSYIDNTYPVLSTFVYGDIYFRQNVAGTMTTRMTIKGDGGNVGIGTTAPASKFEVFGGDMSLKMTGVTTGSILFKNSSGTKIQEIRYDDSDGSMTLGGVGSYPIKFITSTTEKVRISGTGNVGIGTTNPTYKLQIGTVGSLADSIRIGTYQVAKNTRQYIGYARDDSGLFESAGNGDTPSTVLGGVSGIRIVNTQGTSYAPQADNSVQLLTHIYNNGSRVALHANYDGNVGIGTTSPASKLHIDDASTPYITITRAGVPTWQLRNNFPSNQYGFSFNNTTAGTVPLFIGTGGNIGIGLDNPTVKLDIASTQGNGIVMRYDTSTAYQAWIRPYWNSNTDSRIDFAINRTANVTPDVIMSVGYGGNVGIGTTSPVARLTVTPSGSAFDSSNTMVAYFGKTTANGYGSTFIRVARSDSTTTTGSNAEYTDIEHNSGGATPFRYGTYSDTNIINGGAATNGVYGSINFVTSGSTRMTIAGGTSAGNVGIGTTNPGYKLHVTGDIYANGGWLRVSGTSGLYFETYGGGWFMDDATWVRTYSAKSVWTSTGLLGSNGGLTVGYGGTSPTSLGAIIAGSVGIGTNSPATKLEVYGVVRVSESSSGGILQLTAGASAIDIASTFYGGSRRPITFTMDSEKVRIAADGNVGIGTTSPANKLHVEGGNSVPLYVKGGTSAWVIFERNTKQLYLNANYSDTNLYAQISPRSSDSMSLSLSSREVAGDLLVSTSGNVGIGTTSPATLLHVDTAGADARIRVSAGTNTVQGGMIANTNGLVYAGSITNHGFSLRTNDTDRVRIQTDGNVGIGITSPTVKLTVSADVTDADVGQLRLVGSTSSAKMLSLGYQTTSNYGFISALIAGTGYSNLALQPNGGNVGIGTTTGTFTLNVYNNADVWHARFGSATGEVRIGGQTSSGAVIQSFVPGSGTVRDLYLQRDGGNIGVGLNNPSSKIHIYENANRVTYITQNNNHTARFEAYGTATAIDTTASNGIFFRISGGDIVKFAADGNVGIGTSLPGRKLDVEGVVRTRGATGTGGFEIGAATTGTAKWRIEWDSASDSLDFNWVG